VHDKSRCFQDYITALDPFFFPAELISPYSSSTVLVARELFIHPIFKFYKIMVNSTSVLLVGVAALGVVAPSYANSVEEGVLEARGPRRSGGGSRYA
jgi:hypothetical protein